jgi:hypothetical protein
MSKAYVVTQGAYSDYHIVGVFTTEENAKIYADRINAGQPYSSADIEEYELDEAVNRQFLYQTHIYISRRTETGFNKDTRLVHPDEYKFGLNTESHIGYSTGRLKEPYVMAYANTVEQAEKIAHDLWAQVQANEAGI